MKFVVLDIIEDHVKVRLSGVGISKMETIACPRKRPTDTHTRLVTVRIVVSVALYAKKKDEELAETVHLAKSVRTKVLLAIRRARTVLKIHTHPVVVRQ
jgi:hypothetical protein